MKYRDWLQEWLGYYAKPSVKAKTYEKYARQVRRYLAPRLGGYAPEELTPLRLQKFAVSLTDGGLSANTANGIITVLQSSLRAAVNAGKAEREHGKSVVRPKIREKQVECFSKAEQKKPEGHTFTANGALLKKLGIPHKGFHALRHTFATRAIEVGMDVKTLSEILGHKNPSVTLKRYAHSLLEHKAEMMNKLGKLLI